MNIESLRRRALAAADSRNSKHWESWYSDCSNILMESESELWPEPLFDLVLDLLSHESILHARKSLHVPKLLADEWDCLTASQRERLPPVIERSYSRISDVYSCFVIAELLGEHFANQDSLQALKRLASDRRTVPRAYVAYGLRLFVEHTKDVQLRRLALKELRAMSSDTAPGVRQEVEEGLHRLAKSGILDEPSK